MIDDVEIQLHTAQYKAYMSDARITAFIGGIQSGKSTVGALWMSRITSKEEDQDSNYILASPNYKILTQSAGPVFLKFFRGYGHYNSGTDCFELNSGGKVWFRSMIDPNSCEGLTNVRGIWIDEAGMLSYLAWSNLLGRSAFCKSKIMISTTPYSLNWLYGLYADYKSGALTDALFINCRSVDNPYFPPEEVERQRQILAPAIFRMKFEGTFERPGGLVYACFDPDANQIDAYPINKTNYQIYAGMDIGYNDPTSLIVIAVSRTGKDIIVIDEFYRTGLTVDDRTRVLNQYMRIYGISKIFVDSAHPSEIEHFRRNKIPVEGVVKGKDSIFDGVSKVQELFTTKKLKLMRGKCNNLLDELSMYSYKESKTQGGLSDTISDTYNHALDGLRYACISVWQQFFQNVPKFVPHKTHLQKLLSKELYAEQRVEDEW